MNDTEAMRTALANIKKLAKQSIVDRYKAKKSAPKSEDKPEPEPEHVPDIELEEEEDAEPDADDIEARTEIVNFSKKGSAKKERTEDKPPPKKRGRPPKQK